MMVLASDAGGASGALRTKSPAISHRMKHDGIEPSSVSYI